MWIHFNRNALSFDFILGAVYLPREASDCHHGAVNDILFNPLKSVCIVYKPKYYKLFCPSVNIGSEPLRFVNETKYLGFTFRSMNKDDKDILRKMRSVYARSNRILRMFSHCSIDAKIVLFNSYCTPLYCS